jgi:gamma-glutamyltranspeptidase / glutathione hydrolase
MLRSQSPLGAFWLLLTLPLTMASQERTQARSMVITPLGIVATSQTLASQAGAQILAAGGSAMDAAIAANAVLGVVEPMSCGIGGDLFALYWEARTGKLTGINASGWSPRQWTLEHFRDKGHREMPEEGIHSVTVPGCVAGWRDLHKRFGKLRWRDVLAPSIHFAASGFPVTEIIQDHWREAVRKLSVHEDSRGLFLPGGKPPAVGQIFRNEPLARTMRLLADKGAAAFYTGAIRDAILKTSERLGGTLEAADLAEFEPEWVEPIATDYRGWRVYELPPNGQGMAALEMLNIMERFPLDTLRPFSADAFHYKIEAQKLAYQDLKRYVGDPRLAPVPVETLISKPYAAERARLIDPREARCRVEPGDLRVPSGDTIYLSAVDKEGNVASLIQSLYLSFGSGVLVEDMGFHLQNRGALFDLDDGHPNVIAPRKRPFHTIIPGFMEKGDIRIGFGIMGGLNQAQAHAQFVSNVVDHGMNIQAALEAPRFAKLNFSGCDVYIESRLPENVYDELRSRGHGVLRRGDFYGLMGGGQAVLHDASAGVNYGASSPRKDGAAVPEPVFLSGRQSRR